MLVSLLAGFDSLAFSAVFAKFTSLVFTLATSFSRQSTVESISLELNTNILYKSALYSLDTSTSGITFPLLLLILAPSLTSIPLKVIFLGQCFFGNIAVWWNKKNVR